jgi:hypothetical protein
MAEPSRGLQISRRCWLLAGLAAPLFRARGAETLAVTFDGDNLHVSSPDLHFLTGKPLERLKQGSATVQYGALLTLFSDEYVTPFKHAEAHFVVSYDIWQEDKFSVTMTRPATRSVLNLPASAAETWCLGNLEIDASGLAASRKFWLQLELAVINPRNIDSVLGPGINLWKVMVDLFSQKPVADDLRWKRQVGPLRLADLAHTPVRGARSG